MTNDSSTDHDAMQGGWVPLPRGRSGLVRTLIATLLLLLLAEGGARLAEQSAAAPQLRWYDEAAQIRVELMDGREADVVFAGTSMAQQAFVPSVFNATIGVDQTSFNVGLPGAVPQVTGPWLVDVVVDRLGPSTVVWGLSSLDFSSSYGDRPNEAWQSAPATREDVLGRVDARLADHSALIRYRSLLRRPDDVWGEGADVRAEQFAEERSITGADGERLGFDRERSSQGAAINRARLADSTIDQQDVAAVEQAVEALTAAGIRVILVELPVPPAFIELHPNRATDHDRVGSTIRDLAGRLGVDHIALDTSWVDDDFVDFTHLDAAGAAAFTRSVADVLTATSAGDLVPAIPVEVASDTTSDADVAATDEECVSEVVVDEYGFEIEINSCPSSGDQSETAAPPTFPNDATETAFEAAVSAARSAAAVCADADAWRSEMAVASAEVDQLAVVVEALDPDGEWATGDAPQVLVDALVVELLAQPACASLPHASEEATRTTVGQAITSLHRVAVVFDATASQQGGPFWFRTSQIGHVQSIRDLLAAGENVDILTIGSSTVRRGLNTETLSAATDSTAFNAGVEALDPTVMGPWIRDLIDTGVDPGTIVIGFTSFESLEPCNNGRRNIMSTALDARAATARLGLDVRSISVSSDDPYLTRYQEQHVMLGTTSEVAGTDLARVESETAGYRDRFGTEVCADLIQSFATVTEAILRSFPDARVVVVDMPVQPGLIAAHSVGRPIFDEASAEVQAIADALGIEYLDARDLLSTEEFGDATHANEAGRQLLTQVLADALNQ